jgi:phospholipid/cholesterol/gamma-HCH transport system ATP-binding protein
MIADSSCIPNIRAIEINGLKKSFGSNHVLNGFNLMLQNKENLAVLGQSGSGKSVLIKCVIGLIPPDEGSIAVFGENVVRISQKKIDQIRGHMGFLFQSNALYDSMTVKENLEFPLRRLSIQKTTSESHQLIEEALTDVGLLEAIDLMPSELSGGMRKRISIARTLITKPKIILYDEPTTGLDPITAKEICNLMLNVHQKYNTSSIIISHDIACIQLTAQRIVVLKNGINYAEGTFEELAHSKDKWIKEFFK